MPEEKQKPVSKIIQGWVSKNTILMGGEALCAIYKKYGWLWSDIPKERGNEVCLYLKSVSEEKEKFVEQFNEEER